MRSFLLVLVTALGVLGPGCTCAGRDPGAAATSEASEASAPGGDAGAAATPVGVASATAKLERRRPILRGTGMPTNRLRPGLGRALAAGNGLRLRAPAGSAAPAASDAPDAPAP